MSAADPAPREVYRDRLARLAEERGSLERLSRRLSHGRLAVFLALVGSGVWAEERPGPLPIALAGASLAGFVALVAGHARVRRRARWTADIEAVNAQGPVRLARRWAELPGAPPPAAAEAHPFAADLDLYGRASLRQLLGPPGSAMGEAVLARWLLEGADPEEVAARHGAVRELSRLRDLRDALAVHAHRSDATAEDVDRFIAWTEEPDWLGRRPWLLVSAWLLPIATLALGLLDLLRPEAPSLWLLPLAGALAITMSSPGEGIRRQFGRAFSREGAFEHLPAMLEAVCRARFEAPRLLALRERLSVGGGSADVHMERLRRLMHLADLRYSGMLYLPVQLLTLWDVHVLRALERWRRPAAGAAREWLRALAELEALCALGTLAHDHPDWAFPEVRPESEPRLVARGLGHPLLPEAVRVDNDVTVGPPGTLLFVTGSNMSGKSTLLRAIGVNVTLALSGAPVCAAELRLPPLVLRTSVRVQDSLARGVSYFMAELERLKAVVDEGDRRRDGDRPLLYLLDEILQGTNTAERQVASRRILKHLLRSGAIGVVTSHDLELVEDPALAGAAVPVHFSERFERVEGRATMTFDYRLRPGVATSTNALRLMELVGLEAPGEPGTGPAPPAPG